MTNKTSDQTVSGAESELDIIHEKIAIIDFGGQYAHLIGSRVRSLGVYSEIWGPELEEWFELAPAEQAKFKAIIFSGGPQSVYDPKSPKVDKRVYELGLPILGICYGHQLLMNDLGGVVAKGTVEEYGPAQLKVDGDDPIFRFTADVQHEKNPASHQVWMSHTDHVTKLPAGFSLVASSDDCEVAGVADPARGFFGVQFHPEVTHSSIGDELLSNFLKFAGLGNLWSLDKFLQVEIDYCRKQIGDRKVFLLVSGGVDSSVAYVLLARAIGASHIYPLFVDTGFMRKDEATEVKAAFAGNDLPLEVFDASEIYFEKLKGVYGPEEKRRIIGQLFLETRDKVSHDLGLDPEKWLLGQGTIYPDTIESGGTKHAALIKTHHNRVPEVEELIRQGKVIEPLRQLYKDEVRSLGEKLGLPHSFIARQPFPGPGLGVRILCVAPDDLNRLASERDKLVQGLDDHLKAEQSIFDRADILPIQSVGVKGDARSYEHPIAVHLDHDKLIELPWSEIDDAAVAIGNNVKGVNRVMLELHRTGGEGILWSADANRERVTKLQAADFIVNQFQAESGLLDHIWQFPVCLLPYGEKEGKESIVLRPVQSTEAMTVNFYPMPKEHLDELVTRLTKLDWVSFIYYDLTHKPPGTIEWE